MSPGRARHKDGLTYVGNDEALAACIIFRIWPSLCERRALGVLQIRCNMISTTNRHLLVHYH